jgi:hypothetical protein
VIKVVGYILADIRYDYRNTVNNRILELAGLVGTIQYAFNQAMIVFLNNRGNPERVVGLVRQTAMRTDRAKCFKMFETQPNQPPISTVGQQGGMILPTGLGIGATHVGCAVRSPILAAGSELISTVMDPLAMLPGPAGVHGIKVHIFVISETRAAGSIPINTVIAQGGIMRSGNAGCGTMVGTGAGGCMGA